MTERNWYSPKQIAERYSVSDDTARRWILALTVEASPLNYKNRNKGRRGKRYYSLRRLPESKLKELEEFINQ